MYLVSNQILSICISVKVSQHSESNPMVQTGYGANVSLILFPMKAKPSESTEKSKQPMSRDRESRERPLPLQGTLELQSLAFRL